MTQYTEARMPSEQKWYALTGRVVDAKVEADADIHIALVDASGDGMGTVSAEIPVDPKWREIRQIVFGWTTQKFPFGVKIAHTLKFASNMSSSLRAKRFTILGTRQPIIQTCEDTERLRGVGGPSGNGIAGRPINRQKVYGFFVSRNGTCFRRQGHEKDSSIHKLHSAFPLVGQPCFSSRSSLSAVHFCQNRL